jgi:hypothetical protein
MKEIKNFLPYEQFKELQNLILNIDFPWRIRETMTNEDENIYFTHSFFNKKIINSDLLYINYIIPILNKLNAIAPIEIRANMVLNKIYDKSGWHTDYDFNNFTAILYLNNCDGGTELKIEDKIKFIQSEENKILIFNSKIIHRSVSSNKNDRKYILNFNYF